MNNRFIEECRNDLLQINKCDSATQSTSKTRSTKMDNKLESTLSIRQLSDRLKKTASELRYLHEIFSSDIEVYTKREKQNLLSELTKTDIPFLEYTSIKITHTDLICNYNNSKPIFTTKSNIDKYQNFQ